MVTDATYMFVGEDRTCGVCGQAIPAKSGCIRAHGVFTQPTFRVGYVHFHPPCLETQPAVLANPHLQQALRAWRAAAATTTQTRSNPHV